MLDDKTVVAPGPSALTVGIVCGAVGAACGAGIAFAFCKYKLKMFKS